MADKKLLESKRANLSLIAIASIIGVNVVGHFAGLPSAVTEKITSAIIQLSLGYVAGQTLSDIPKILKEHNGNKNAVNNPNSN